jgi:hypothetical protein
MLSKGGVGGRRRRTSTVVSAVAVAVVVLQDRRPLQGTTAGPHEQPHHMREE